MKYIIVVGTDELLETVPPYPIVFFEARTQEKAIDKFVDFVRERLDEAPKCEWAASLISCENNPGRIVWFMMERVNKVLMPISSDDEDGLVVFGSLGTPK